MEGEVVTVKLNEEDALDLFWVIGVLIIVILSLTSCGPTAPTQPLTQLEELERSVPEEWLPLVGSLAGATKAYDVADSTWLMLNDNWNPAWTAVQFYQNGYSLEYFWDSPLDYAPFDPAQTCATSAPPWCEHSPQGLGWVGIVATMIYAPKISISVDDEPVDNEDGWRQLRIEYVDPSGEARLFLWGVQDPGGPMLRSASYVR